MLEDKERVMEIVRELGSNLDEDKVKSVIRLGEKCFLMP